MTRLWVRAARSFGLMAREVAISSGERPTATRGGAAGGGGHPQARLGLAQQAGGSRLHGASEQVVVVVTGQDHDRGLRIGLLDPAGGPRPPPLPPRRPPTHPPP